MLVMDVRSELDRRLLGAPLLLNWWSKGCVLLRRPRNGVLYSTELELTRRFISAMEMAMELRRALSRWVL